jgi:prepilin-type N-terminal cleavage/methylation domain-containing protein
MLESSVSASTNRSSGFTLVEVNLSIVILSVLLVGVLAIFTNFFVVMTRTNAIVDMTVDSQGLLRTVVEELRYGAGVRQANTISDPNAPPSGWDTDNANFVIVIAVPAVDSDRNYIIDTATGSPYMNELVYFKEADILYKRILAHPDADDNSLTTSCPASLASASCPADRRLVENVHTMDFTLYDQDNASTNDPLLARSIKIDLGLERDTFGEPITYANSVRITLRNTY